MTDLGPRDNAEVISCQYCRGSLDLRYPFCVHCATPHGRAINPAEKEEEFDDDFAPSLETRINTEGRLAVNFFLVLFAGAVLLGSIGELPNSPWAIPIQSALVALVTTLFALYERQDIAYLFRRLKAHWCLLASLPMLTGFLFLNKAYHEFVIRSVGAETVDLFADFRNSVPPLVVTIVLCVMPGVFEEIGFRGFVQERLVRIAGRSTGFVITSVLFVVLHFSLVSAPYLFLLSLYFCWIRDCTRSIYPTIVLHFLHNFAVLFLFSDL